MATKVEQEERRASLAGNLINNFEQLVTAAIRQQGYPNYTSSRAYHWSDGATGFSIRNTHYSVYMSRDRQYFILAERTGNYEEKIHLTTAFGKPTVTCLRLMYEGGEMRILQFLQNSNEALDKIRDLARRIQAE